VSSLDNNSESVFIDSYEQL